MRPLLQQPTDNLHLTGLVLELLDGSPAVEQLEDEIRRIALNSACDSSLRFLAHRLLIAAERYDHRTDAIQLVEKGDCFSLEISARIYMEKGSSAVGLETLCDLLRSCGNLYNERAERPITETGSRYFVRDLVESLSCESVEWLLDCLTRDLRCICGANEKHNCECRIGISKIVGMLLDRYFDSSPSTLDTVQIWGWIRELVFLHQIGHEESRSVEALRGNHGLRRAIHQHVLSSARDRRHAFDMQLEAFTIASHSGLSFQPEDYVELAEFAFETENHELWSSLVPAHNPHLGPDKRGPDDLRRNMRAHAREKPEFLRSWAKQNRAANEYVRTHRYRGRTRRRGRRSAEQLRTKRRKTNRKFFEDNRNVIESGRHWSVLRFFSSLVLNEPEKIESETGDTQLVRRALSNCLDFIEPHVPTLRELAELQCTSQGHIVEPVLLAACLEIMRSEGTLAGVSPHLLSALKTNIDVGYRAVSSDDRAELEEEIDRLLFADEENAEDFLRWYIEPQLRDGRCKFTQVHWLRDKQAFVSASGKLSLDWLSRYPEASIDAMETLFDVAVETVDRSQLDELIELRCAELLQQHPIPSDDSTVEARRRFWFARHFFFLGGGPDAVGQWLREDRETIFLLEYRSRAIKHGGVSDWPRLSARKVHTVLDAFVDVWPKVPLPNSWGSHSPKRETAYRFLSNIIWTIENDEPDEGLRVLEELLADGRFDSFSSSFKSMRATLRSRLALGDYSPPSTNEVVQLLGHGVVATVEGLRALLIRELNLLQGEIDGGEFDTLELFYNGSNRVGENAASIRIAERLQLRLHAQNLAVAVEHQLKAAKRCDISVTWMHRGNRKLLVIETKGQWHDQLYEAASAQLKDRYAIHPDAERQGIYLVLWFGGEELIAGRIDRQITSAEEMLEAVRKSIPSQQSGLIDVFVLDLSRGHQ